MSLKDNNWDVVVIGGGFFGCQVALLMRAFFSKILILEEASDLFSRASKHNQARVHAGYHYPRSLLTACRSQFNYKKFCTDYKSAIVDDFDQLYAIACYNSKVNAYQFQQRFSEMQCPLERAPKAYRDLFNPDLIEDVFSVKEVVFDHNQLRALTVRDLQEKGITFNTGSKVVSVLPSADKGVEVTTSQGVSHYAKHVFNCTYSRVHSLFTNTANESYNLRHEITEICLVELPSLLQKLSITVMDGPFFSTMPFPSERCHSLTHVRYTPHLAWEEESGEYQDPYQVLDNTPLNSNFLLMLRDAARYIPLLKDVRHLRSLYEVKTVLQQNEHDDGRPILLKWNSGIPNVHTVLGAKLDNIYDVNNLLNEHFGSPGHS